MILKTTPFSLFLFLVFVVSCSKQEAGPPASETAQVPPVSGVEKPGVPSANHPQEGSPPPAVKGAGESGQARALAEGDGATKARQPASTPPTPASRATARVQAMEAMLRARKPASPAASK